MDKPPEIAIINQGYEGRAGLNKEILEQSEFLKKIIDAVPSLVFVVDSDVCIFQLNSSASNSLGLNLAQVQKKRGGDILHCIHALEAPGGCGHDEACTDCVIRSSVGRAFDGDAVYRKHSRLLLKTDGRSTALHLLVTASPFEYQQERYALLILDDISELVQLRSLLPICAGCKNVRNDQEYWETIEHYLSSHVDIEFTHGLCPDCAARLYPDLFPED